MLIDLHAHSSGISWCCRKPVSDILKTARDFGIDGIVLTNHYMKNYVNEGGPSELVKRYIAEYDEAVRFGKELGMTVFFGIEATLDKCFDAHMLIYGVKTDFLLENPTLYDYTQEFLYKRVNEAGGALVQAHPKRSPTCPILDTEYLDGLELNCHPKYSGPHRELLCEIAERDGLIVTAGGDYHADSPRTKCGMYLDSSLKSVELGKYLKSSNYVNLCLQNTLDTEPYDFLYKRSKKQKGNSKP
jgi:predicted metal-dependent phosphoesterase TrpH